jgi:hypothetical protein
MNFAEILFLLALDVKQGIIRPEMERSLDYALAGALLMDLAIRNRVDTDLTCIRHDPKEESRDPLLLRVVDKSPTGDGLLDEALKELQYKSDPRPTREWLDHFSGEGKMIRERVAAQLAASKVLEIKEEKKLIFFKSRRYILADSSGMDAVKSRLGKLVMSDEIPDPREVVLVGIANSCGLFDVMFSPEDLARVRPRINALRKLDLIGQAMTGIIREIEHSISTEMRPG